MCKKDKCCCPSSKAGKKKVAGKKRRGKVGKARLNASQVLAMGASIPRAVPAVPAVPLYTNNPLGENQLTAKQMNVQTIATQTEKNIEEIKPMFRRINADVEVPKPKSIATSSGSYTYMTTPSRSNAEMAMLLKKVV